MSSLTQNYLRWLEVLRPFDSSGDIKALATLAEEIDSGDRWNLLAEEALLKLVGADIPATALMVVMAIHNERGIKTSTQLAAAEKVGTTAFNSPPSDAKIQTSWLKETQRLAVALHALFDDYLASDLKASTPALAIQAGLELLSKLYEPRYNFGSALPELVDRLRPDYPVIVTEIEACLSREFQLHEATPATADELEAWQKEFKQLGEELEKKITIRHTRGLALLSRIQADNNQRIFRPLLEAIYSTDPLDKETVDSVHGLSGESLLERHPLQLTAPARRRIVGSARNETARHYEDLRRKLKRATELRLDLDRQPSGQRAARRSLSEGTRRLIKQWKQGGLDPSNWPLIRLLAGETLLSVRRVPVPDPSLVLRPDAAPLRLACLYAACEPATLARFPNLVVGLMDPSGGASLLLEALAARNQPTEEDLRTRCGDLLERGFFGVARIWATVTGDLMSQLPDFRQYVEESTTAARREVLSRLEDSHREHLRQAVGSLSYERVEKDVRSLVDSGFLKAATGQLDALEVSARETKADFDAQAPSGTAANAKIPEGKPPSETTSTEVDSTTNSAFLAHGPPPLPSVVADTAVTVDPKIERVFARGERHRVTGHLSHADRDLRQVLQMDPHHRRARSQLSLVLDGRGHRTEAIELLLEGHRYAQTHLPFLNQLTVLLRLQNRLAEARRYALLGLEYCNTPLQEVGFLNELVNVERRRGNVDAALTYLDRLKRLRPDVAHYRQFYEQLSTQGTVRPIPQGEVEDRIVQDEEELLPWEMLPDELEISAFLEEDLRREHTKVGPDFVEQGKPQKAVDEAVRLWQIGTTAPDSARPGEDAENLRTAAKLLMEVNERHPDFDFSAYHLTKRAQGVEFPKLSNYESALRKFVSYYAAHMGDHHFRAQRMESARAYYLEHFRVFAGLWPFSLTPAQKYIWTTLPETGDLVQHVKEMLRKRYKRSSDRSRYAPEAFLVMFVTAIEKYILDADRVEEHRLDHFLYDFLDVCNANAAARAAMLKFVEQKHHAVPRLVLRLKKLGVLGIEVDSPRDWVAQALKAREEFRRKTQHDFTFLLENLLHPRRFEEAAQLLGEIRKRGVSAVDERLLTQTQEILRLTGRYHTASQFSDKRYLASDLQLRIHSLQSEIDLEPTAIGRVHVAPILFRLSRSTEFSFAEYKSRSLPSLAFSAVKSVRRSEVVRCDFQIENRGLSPAENVNLYFIAEPRSTVKIGSFQIPRVAPGAANAVVVKVNLKVAVNRDENAIAVSVRGNFEDIDGKEYTVEPSNVRLDVSTHKTFVPIHNPYVTGRIIKDESLFKGRDRLIDEIIREVGNPATPGAVVMYGQKRCGKSSVLYWVAESVPDHIVPVSIPLQNMFADSEVLANLLYNIAENIADEAAIRRGLEFPRIDPDEIFDSRVPSRVFLHYLHRVNKTLSSECLLLLLFDEFTDLTLRIEDGSIERGFMRFLKSLIEQGLFSCVICGIDSMPKVLKSFSNEFAIANPRRVSYLDKASALELIEQPISMPDSSSRFVEGAAERILQLTAGSPYYIQLVCSRLVDWLNREENPDPRITRADVDQTVREIVEGAVPLNPWTVFDSLSKYKEDHEKDTRASILEGLAFYLVADGMRSAEYVTHETLAQRMEGMAREDEVESVLNELIDRETLVMPSGTPVRQYRIRVELYYRWIIANRALDEQALLGFRRRLDAVSVGRPINSAN